MKNDYIEIIVRNLDENGTKKDYIFYNPFDDRLSLLGAELDESIDELDQFTMTVPSTHPGLSLIKVLVSTIIVRVNDKIIFKGRAISDDYDINRTHTFVCESQIGYLNDTVYANHEDGKEMDIAKNYSGTPKGLIKDVINSHNFRVTHPKKISLDFDIPSEYGEADGFKIELNKEKISDYTKSIDIIKKYILEPYGLSIKADYNFESDQYDARLIFYKQRESYGDGASISSVDAVLGENIADIKVQRDSTSRISALIPLGAYAEIEQTNDNGEKEIVQQDYRISIPYQQDPRYPNDKSRKVKYLIDPNTVGEIGYVYDTSVYDEIINPTDLLLISKIEFANRKDGIDMVTLTVAEEHIGEFSVGKFVRCYSEPHGLTGQYLLCKTKTTDFLNIGNTTLELTANLRGISDLTSKFSNSNDELSNAIIKVKNDSAESEKVLRKEINSQIDISNDKIETAINEYDYLDAELDRRASSNITQTSTDYLISFEEQYENMQKELDMWFKFSVNGFDIGTERSKLSTHIDNDSIDFLNGSMTVASMSGNKLFVPNAELGNFTIGDYVVETSGLGEIRLVHDFKM